MPGDAFDKQTDADSHVDPGNDATQDATASESAFAELDMSPGQQQTSATQGNQDRRSRRAPADFYSSFMYGPTLWGEMLVRGNATAIPSMTSMVPGSLANLGVTGAILNTAMGRPALTWTGPAVSLLAQVAVGAFFQSPAPIGARTGDAADTAPTSQAQQNLTPSTQ